MGGYMLQDNSTEVVQIAIKRRGNLIDIHLIYNIQNVKSVNNLTSYL